MIALWLTFPPDQTCVAAPRSPPYGKQTCRPLIFNCSPPPLATGVLPSRHDPGSRLRRRLQRGLRAGGALSRRRRRRHRRAPPAAGDRVRRQDASVRADGDGVVQRGPGAVPPGDGQAAGPHQAARAVRAAPPSEGEGGRQTTGSCDGGAVRVRGEGRTAPTTGCFESSAACRWECVTLPRAVSRAPPLGRQLHPGIQHNSSVNGKCVQ